MPKHYKKKLLADNFIKLKRHVFLKADI